MFATPADAAAYNRWANARLYGAAFEIDDAGYRRDLGLFFKSLHGTLNHILVGDRIWMRRLTGEGPQPTALDAIMYDGIAELAAARAAEDARIVAYASGLTRADLDGDLAYATTSGAAHTQRRGDVLAHFFNHQTHHRGQAHAALSILRPGVEPPSLDLLQLQRGVTAPDLAALAAERAVG